MRNRYVLIADIVAVALAAWLAFAFRFGWLFHSSRPEFIPFLIIVVVVKILVFGGFGLYHRYWRYAGFWDLMAVVLANAAASLLVAVIMIGLRLGGAIEGLSRSVLPSDWLLALALTTGLRASVRAIAETRARRRPVRGASVQRRILIIGAGDAGSLMSREMQRNPHLGMKPVGFLDDDPSKRGKRIYGVRVAGAIADLPHVLKQGHIDEAVIAIPAAGGAVIRQVVELCRAQGVPSRAIPGILELIDGQVSISRLRDVDIVDLLRRPQVQASTDVVEYLQDAAVIVTGAGGSIGSELCRQVARSGPRLLVLLGHGENSIFQIEHEIRARFPAVTVQSVIADVRDRERIAHVFRKVRPDVVFHAAAHKHVPLMEDNISEAVTNNIAGTRNVVDSALEAGTPRLVFVSTDKAVAPSSVMGASKRMAEMVIRAAARRSGLPYVTVRFGNVLGSRGSVVPIFKEQIERGGPVTVTHPDVCRFFMTIPEAVHLILKAGGIGRGGELFVLDMGKPVLLRDLAADMIRLSGLSEADIPVVFTGLRPGEKLTESLWEEGAAAAATLQPDIREVQEPEAAAGDRLTDIVVRLVDAAAREDRARIVRLLTEAIPSADLAAVSVHWDRGQVPSIVSRASTQP
jgi:FlaA1/EpsC-like NDP-sugar epimerase